MEWSVSASGESVICEPVAEGSEVSDSRAGHTALTLKRPCVFQNNNTGGSTT